METRHEYFAMLNRITTALSGLSDPMSATMFNKLSMLFDLMEIRASGGRQMSIDLKNSGLPMAADVLAVANDFVHGVTGGDKSPEAVKREMLDEILLRRRLPDQRMQDNLARSLYARGVEKAVSDELNVFVPHPEGPKYLNALEGQNTYELLWDAWDASVNKAIFCRVVIILHPEARNLVLGELMNATATHGMNFSGEGFKIATLAQEIADLSENIIVGKVERVIVGPLLSGSFSTMDDPVRGAFDNLPDQDDAWSIRWTHEMVEAGSVREVRNGIFSTRQAQNFVVDTSDPDCAMRGATRVNHHVAMPHAVYQQIADERNAFPSLKGASIHVVSQNRLIEYS